MTPTPARPRPSFRVRLAAWLLLLVACSVLIALRATISADMTAFMPRSDDPARQSLVSVLRDGPASRVVLLAIEHGPFDQAASVSDDARARQLVALRGALAGALRATGRFSRVSDGTLPPGDPLAALFAWRYLLTDAGGDLSETALRQALKLRLAEMHDAFGMVDAKVLGADPVAAGRELLLRLLPASSSTPPGAANAAPDAAAWLSPDRRRALLLVELGAAGYDLDAQAQALTEIKAAFATVSAADAVAGKVEGNAALTVAAPRLLMAGPPVFAVHSREVIRGESQRLAMVASLALVAFLGLVFRSGRMLVLGAVPVLTGMLVASATTVLVFGTVHGITLAFGITLLGVTLDYPMHVYSHARPGRVLDATLRDIWPTLRLGVITTSFAFAVLGASRFDGLAQLALFSASGLIAAAMCTRWVLPALFPADWQPQRAPLGAHLPAAPALARRLTRWGLGAFGVAALALLATSDSVWENDLAALSPVAASDIALDTELRAAIGAPDVRHVIVVPGRSEAQALLHSEALLPTLDALVDDGAIAGYDLAARYLPSPATQSRRIAALPDAATLSRSLAAAQANTPFRPGAFAAFERDVAASRSLPPVDAAGLADTLLGARVAALLPSGESGVSALVQLSGVAAPAAIAPALVGGKDLPEAYYIDLKRASDRAVTAYRNDTLRLLAWAVPVMLVSLLVGRRSVRAVLRIGVALALGVVIDMAALVALGERLSLFHLVAVLLVVGIGIDYGLFFARDTAGDQVSRARTVHGIAVCAVSTLLVFGLLASSQLPVLRAVGLTVALGIVTTWLATWALVQPGGGQSGRSLATVPDAPR